MVTGSPCPKLTTKEDAPIASGVTVTKVPSSKLLASGPEEISKLEKVISVSPGPLEFKLGCSGSNSSSQPTMIPVIKRAGISVLNKFIVCAF